MSDKTTVSTDLEVKEKWLRSVFAWEPGRPRSGAISIGKGRQPPQPQWTPSSKPSGDQGGPKIGEERNLEGAFMKRLGESLNAIDIARGLKPASKDAETAAKAMEQSLSDMQEAIDNKDFVTAGSKLDAALKHADTISDARVKAKKLFDDAFYPLQTQLRDGLRHTGAVTGLAPAVGVAEQEAHDAAAAAETAADQDDYALANEKLKAFQTAMLELGTAYTNAADAMNDLLTRRIARLARRQEALKGTGLTTPAADCQKAVDVARKGQTDANRVTPQEARLAALYGVLEKVQEADAVGQQALKAKFNTGAANGLVEIRKAAGTAVAALADGDAKRDLLAKLQEWDKQKTACDKEKDLDKQKAALEKLDTDARKIMSDAANLDLAAKKTKLVNDAKSDPRGEVPALIAATKNAIAALSNGDTKTALLNEADLNGRNYDGWLAAPDSTDKTNALAEHPPFWPKLLERVLKAAQEEKRQAAFKDALEKRYGLTITVPPGMSNTHFDQFYDMMDRLPIQQTSQSSLKALTYDKSSKGAAFYPGGPGKVEMGNFGAAEKWNYQDPKTKTVLPMTAFSINTLHEIGHSVDEKYSIMKNNKSNAGCGKWNDTETLATVITAFIKELKKAAGNTLHANDTVLTALFNTALTKGAVTDPTTKRKSVNDTPDTDKPGTMSPQEWRVVKEHLNRAIKIRADNWPWGDGKAVVMGGRAYHEAYDGQWVSYDPAARNGTEVRDYQFRSPAEWFAELYAFTWFKKVKAPTGVDKTVTKYMWSAKA
jgi:hypothetical protein